MTRLYIRQTRKYNVTANKILCCDDGCVCLNTGISNIHIENDCSKNKITCLINNEQCIQRLFLHLNSSPHEGRVICIESIECIQVSPCVINVTMIVAKHENDMSACISLI